MSEIIKQFFWTVCTAFREELAGQKTGFFITVLCMLAFGSIFTGLFISSRLAVLYYVAEKGQRRLLGSLYIRAIPEGFSMSVPERWLERSDSIYYYLKIPDGFAHAHYMEPFFIRLPGGSQRHGIKKQIHFKVGMESCTNTCTD